MQEYLSKDVSRCSGRLNGIGVNCHLRFDCLRFLQYAKDKEEGKEQTYINPPPFEGLKCVLFKKKQK